MNPHIPPNEARIDDLFDLVLADGLKLTADGKDIFYRRVTLRETNVADERKAEALSERAIQAGGSWKLLVSESNFKHALNMLHLESFHCDGDTIPRALIDLALYDKLSSRDLELIEERIFLLTLAAEVRYGNMSQADFEATVAGLKPKAVASASPQSLGQAAGVGAVDAQPESGPSMLADFTRPDPDRAAAGDGAAAPKTSLSA